jgi:NPCBM/NEW2 domain
MSLPRTFLIVLVLAPALSAAELATLDGRKLTGEIISIVGNELVFKSAASEEKFLVTTLHSVTLGPTPKTIDTGKKHTIVELTDGSVFRCESIAIKGLQVEMKLLGAMPRTLAVHMRREGGEGGDVFAVNREAGDLKLDQDFRRILRTRGRFDILITREKAKSDDGKEIERLDGIPGTFGEGDATGTTIKFTMDRGKDNIVRKDSDLRLTQVAGMIFNQKARKESPPPSICRVIDLDGNELVAQAVVRSDKGFAITTVCGVKVDLADNQVSKFDFAAGAVKFLSDLEPVALDESGTDPEHYQKDKNLDKRPIMLFVDPAMGKTETFPKGITLHAKTVITFELKGQYKVFKGMVGVDADPDNVAPSHIKLTIDDGMQPLFKGTIKKGDKPLDLNLNVTNVDRLKITVESDGTVTDLGNQVSIGNARVLK